MIYLAAFLNLAIKPISDIPEIINVLSGVSFVYVSYQIRNGKTVFL